MFSRWSRRHNKAFRSWGGRALQRGCLVGRSTNGLRPLERRPLNISPKDSCILKRKDGQGPCNYLFLWNTVPAVVSEISTLPSISLERERVLEKPILFNTVYWVYVLPYHHVIVDGVQCPIQHELGWEASLVQICPRTDAHFNTKRFPHKQVFQGQHILSYQRFPVPRNTI